jgi:hypothetical protein
MTGSLRPIDDHTFVGWAFVSNARSSLGVTRLTLASARVNGDDGRHCTHRWLSVKNPLHLPPCSEEHGHVKRPSDKEVARSVPSTYEIRDHVVWPGDLSLPARPPKLVYLDLLVFIHLARVATGTAPPGYAELLKACQRSRAQGRALFPLSSTHVLEVFNITSVEQRRSLVAVMEELSGFNYLLGRPQIQQLEVEAAINEIPGVRIAPQGPIPLIGPSLLRAFGRRGGLKIYGPNPAAAAAQACQTLGIDPGTDAIASLERWAERQLLTGPDDHNDPALASAGYDLEGWRKTLKNRAEQERQLVAELDGDPEFRRGRLRDLINAWETRIELKGVLDEITAALNISFVDLLERDRSKARDFNDGMPSTRVAVSLRERYHRDGRHEWTCNDIQDIDALAIAVPYCDAVYADKAARNGVVSSRELDVFGTFLPRRPNELAEWLDGLPAPAADT